ncbi:MAG: S8 family serine peptidase [Candidatus Hodarchaeales archaeon]
MERTLAKNIFVLILFAVSFYSNFTTSHGIVIELSWNLEQISIEEAWNITQGSENITIAVIDTGIDFNHSSLNESAWININEIPDNGIDDDNNGYIDDLNGWDFYNDDNNPSYSSYDPLNYHGTFVAGIIAAKHLEQKNAWGIAPNVKIMSLRIFGLNPYDEHTTDDILVHAINYAIDNGADIINLSLESPIGSFTLLKSIKKAILRGIPVLASTGNSSGGGNNQTSFPARYSDLIAVGATNFEQEKADYSNYGDNIEIVAPAGEGKNPIISTVLNNGFSTGYGTSFATPQVAAVIALMKTVHSNLTVDEIRFILQSTAIDLNSTGWDIYTGWGLINASAAVLASLNFTGIPSPNNKFPWNFLTTFDLTTYLFLMSVIVLKKKKKRRE